MLRRFLVAAFAVMIPCLIASGPAYGQIVNVQNLAGKAVKDGLSGNVGLNFNLRAGNVQLLLTGAKFTSYYKFGENVVLLTAKGDYGLKGSVGEWQDEPFRERVFEHLRYRRALAGEWSVETFVQHEYDRWRRLRLRFLAGVGPRLDIPISKRAHAGVGFAYMYQGEELLKPKPGDIAGFYAEHRISTYITGGIKVSDSVALSGTAYFQPRIDDPMDARAMIDGVLTVALTRKLGLKVLYVIAIDTRPPESVRGYDLTTKIGFSWAI